MTHDSAAWEQQFKRLNARSGRDPSAFLDALPAGYAALTPPALALRDFHRLHELSPEHPSLVQLWCAPRAQEKAFHRLQIYSSSAIALDELMPYLQNLGFRIFDQVGFTLNQIDHQVFIHSFFVSAPENSVAPLRQLRRLLLDALSSLLSGRVENDGLNRLAASTGLPWQDIDLFRAYRNYYCQWNPHCTPERFQHALQDNPKVLILLFRYFESRFGSDQKLPTIAKREEEILPAIRLELGAAFQQVADGGADRILRDLFNLIDATLRTNHYLHRDEPDRFLALKIDSQGLFAMPSPKPCYEIYVHSPTMEGIHLRGAKVARGGIRWSERADDFRSEILDLMQTQTIKNALIVPHGAKGGFIVKNRSPSRREAQEQARAAYRTLIRGLLDLTDNRDEHGGRLPAAVVAYDDDDPYLVVAADRGTTHFSDLANAVAGEYRFWLGDAFASGGSRGYDHKKLGITARGAWECIKRHFAEMGRDPERQAFTAVGVGSMDGDVFGNGVLQSRQLRLRGAFGSRHIFLDPDPDPETSFRERARLFQLDGGAWTDYDPALISAGGGVFSRNARDIPLTAAVREWLGLRRHAVDGEELVRLLLTAPVDLLWLGGIGTYVKASGENHDDVGDRGNDGIRVDACELRARVVGEGANLGFTQRGRIEYALMDGRINTDAVDNSAGVDLSDHEVNLKILMTQLENQSLIGGPEARDGWLTIVAGDVCAAVLEHNARQSLALSLDLERCRQDPAPFLDTADYLAGAGHLDRRAVSFPGRKEIATGEARPLTRPDLAILMPCTKLALKRALLESGSCVERWRFDDLYKDYFPRAIRERFADHLPSHLLARDIAASQVANWIVDRAGSSFLTWNGSPDPPPLCEQISAYLLFDRIFDCEALREKIRNGGSLLPVDRSYQLLIDIEKLLAHCCHWQLQRGRPVEPESGAIAQQRRALAKYLQYLQNTHGTLAPEPAGDSVLNAAEMLLLSSWQALREFPVLLEIAERSSADPYQAATLYFGLARELGITPLLARLATSGQSDYWERKTRTEADFRLRLNLMRLASASTARGDGFFGETNRNADLDRFARRCRELAGLPMVPIYGISAMALEFETLLDRVGSVGLNRPNPD